MANTGKADIVKDYIEWAVTHDFGVIDVNVPKHVTTNAVSNRSLVPLSNASFANFR
jgi:histone deacetylase 6